MKTKQIIFLAISALFTTMVYLFFFGESGYLRQKRLQENLRYIQANIEDLHQENELLNSRYQLLLEEQSEDEEEEKTFQRATILKFEQTLGYGETFLEQKPWDLVELDLREFRVLFLLFMFGFTIAGLYGLHFVDNDPTTLLAVLFESLLGEALAGFHPL